MARRASKVDETQSSIVAHLRGRGWALLLTHVVGGGAPDAFASRLGHTAALEFKTGKGDLNTLQRKFRDGWAGAYFVVRSPEDAEKQLSLWLLSLARLK
jgi:hypothetical protein